MRIVRLSRHGNSLHIAVPKHYLAALAWSEGDQILVTIDNGLLVASRVPMETFARAEAEVAAAAVDHAQA
jgi:antitoxin component of MazEF toxin-antitoxin module